MKPKTGGFHCSSINLTGDDYYPHVLDVSADEFATSASDPTPVFVPGLWTFGTINAFRRWGLEFDYKFQSSRLAAKSRPGVLLGRAFLFLGKLC